jgi:subtilisin family serine protease
MTPHRASTLRITATSAIAIAIAFGWMPGASPRAAAGAPQIAQELHARAQRDGHVRVIIEINLAADRFVPEARLPDTVGVLSQRRAIAAATARILSKLPSGRRVMHRYQTVPYLALDLSPDELTALEDSSSDIVRVLDDAIVRPVLAESVPLIEGDQAWDAGYDGSGTMIAVVDTGVDSTHPFLAGKVAEEACFSSTVAGVSSSFCPNGQEQQIGPGSAVPCTLSDCIHGTHVAGIAAGNGTSAQQPFSGVAKGAGLIAVQVFSKITSAQSCGGLAPCAGAFTSDIIAGLEYVYATAATHNIASVNMSLGGELFTPPCDDQPYKTIIDNLRAIGIATVVASGNNASGSQISTPACISSAVSVGSTTKTDDVSWFSNVAASLSLFAPGESITSSVPGGLFQALSGTSMAAPHVAGTWAVMTQAVPGASVDTILQSLQQNGLPIVDTRLWGGGATVPRVRILRALADLVPIVNPSPAVTALSPEHIRAGSGTTSVAITGSGFNTFSVAQWNGASRPTTVLSTVKLLASIPASDLVSTGTAQVSVSTPAPGGGVSSSLTFTIDPGPSLEVSASAVAPSGEVTVTLANGIGGASDWLALAPVGASDSGYSQWTYVGAGLATRTWTVNMPATAGTYEFRLYVNNARVASSPPVVVDPAISASPKLTSMTPGGAATGSAAFTLVATGSNFVAASVIRWNGANRPTTFVSSTQLSAAIPATDLAASGTAQVTVFSPAPGGGTSAALPFTIGGTPTLNVSATNVAGGAPVTVTLTDGFGGSADWLALAPTTAPNGSYLLWTYVGSGVTTRTWTVNVPTTPGTYEFRLFLNNGSTRAATSPTVTVAAGPSQTPVLTSINPGSAPTGGAAFTLVATGSNFVAASVVRWNGADRPTAFVNSTQLSAAIPATDLGVGGTAQVTVFSPAPGGGTSNALPFTIGGSPTLSVSATTVAAGAPVTVTLTNGFGGSADWLALAASTAPNVSYLQWVYVGAGVTTRTWTVNMPATAGAFEFRLFLNNGSTRAATSPTVTVAAGPSQTPVLTSINPGSAPTGGAAFTLVATGSNFVAASVIRWNGANRPTTFVSSTQISAAIPATDLAVSGTAQVTIFSPAPGGGTSAALPFTIGGTPTLSVSATSVAAGASVTVTLTNGFGGSADWLALAESGASNLNYSKWIYVGSGVTTRTWTVNMPATAGTYEFRLFLNNGYTRAATSPPVTVAP